MSINNISRMKTNWRNSSQITQYPYYRLKFAWFPKRLKDNSLVFWKRYYTGDNYLYYRSIMFKIERNVLGNISEEEYLVKILAGEINNFPESKE